MKLQIHIIFAIILVLCSFAKAQDAQTEPGKTVPPAPINHANGDDVLEQLQGGSKDLFIIIFYVDEAVAGQVEADINTRIVGADYPWARVTKVDFTKVQDYYKLFRVLNLEGEPKRGHTEPQVLVLRDGEGIVIRGPKIVDGILKRIDRIQNGSIYGQSGNTPDVNAYSFGG